MNQEIIERGNNARIILNLPAFQAVCGYIESEIFKEFRDTDVMDRSKREEVHRIMYAFDVLLDRLSKYVDKADAEIAIAEHTPNT